MNEDDKAKIRELRMCGCSYGQIAKTLKMPVSTVSSFCLRHEIEPLDDTFNRLSAPYIKKCLGCGKLFFVNKNQKRDFCSQKCRVDFWKTGQQEEELLTQEGEYYMTLQKELDFLALQSDELDGEEMELSSTNTKCREEE